MESAEKQTVLLVDFSALFRRCWHVSSEQSHAYEGTLSGVKRAIAMTPGCLVAICCDGRGNWRKDLSTEYKAHREKQPNEMFGEMDRTLDRLRADGHVIWKFDGFEADDVIATAAMMATTRGHTCRIVSHDKDLLQLLSVACDYLAIHKDPWEVVDRDIVVNKYGVDSKTFVDWLALVGDSSDNVKGCPGVGAKTATALLQSFGSLEGVYKAAVEGANGITPNVQKNLISNKADVDLAKKLVSLSREVPIKFDELYGERKPEPMVADDYENQLDNLNDSPKAEEPSVSESEPSGDSEQPEHEQDGSPEEIRSPEAKEADTAHAPAELIKAEPVEMLLSVDFNRALEPRSFKETVVYARVMRNSKVFSRYPTTESMVAAIVRGREMGYGAGASLDAFHVADFENDGNLRLLMHAHLIAEQAMRHPDIEYVMLVSSSDKECTYEAKRRSQPKVTRLTYTIEQAQLAGLVRTTRSGRPNNWMKRPSEQLRKTCCAQISRIIAPGAAMGLYCPEEMGIDNEN